MMNVKVKILFSDNQMKKLRTHSKKSKPFSVRLSNDQIFHKDGAEIEVTNEQYKKMTSAKNSKAKRGYVITFDGKQSGGLIFTIPALIAGLTATATAAAPVVATSALGATAAFGTTKALEAIGGSIGTGLVPLGNKRKGRGMSKKKKPKK